MSTVSSGAYSTTIIIGKPKQIAHLTCPACGRSEIRNAAHLMSASVCTWGGHPATVMNHVIEDVDPS